MCLKDWNSYKNVHWKCNLFECLYNIFRYESTSKLIFKGTCGFYLLYFNFYHYINCQFKFIKWLKGNDPVTSFEFRFDYLSYLNIEILAWGYLTVLYKKYRDRTLISTNNNALPSKKRKFPQSAYTYNVTLFSRAYYSETIFLSFFKFLYFNI